MTTKQAPLNIAVAALERIGKLGGPEIDAEATCLQCCESLGACEEDNNSWCPGQVARIALAAICSALCPTCGKEEK